MLDLDYSRRDGESIIDYEYRICSYKDQIGTWKDVADIINKQLHQQYTESKYRKKYQCMNKATDISKNDSTDCESIDTNKKILQNIKEQIRNLEKAKIQMRDERNELSRIYRETARQDYFYEMISKYIEGYKPSGFTCFRFDKDSSYDTDIIIPISDLHFGININNKYNIYNKDTASDRMSRYIGKIIEISKRHNSKNAHIILLGDQISGLIHTSLRLENNENVIKQVMDASELISSFIYNLSYSFCNISVYSISGNHSRICQDKVLNQKGEDLDKFIPFYIKAKLQNCNNVKIYDNTIDESIASFTCRNLLVYAVHGDKDNIQSVAQKITMFTGNKPDIIYMGHLHTNQLISAYDTKIIQSGCISGPDSYCMDNRLRNKPEQAVSIICDNGLECIYNVSLE